MWGSYSDHISFILETIIMGECDGEVKTVGDSSGGVKLKKTLGLHNGVAIIVGIIIGVYEIDIAKH